jgi:hypothetical protein
VVVSGLPLEQDSGKDPTVRLMAYSNLIRVLQDEINREVNLAPVIIAYLRGLRMFPEHRDTTVMYLDTIEVSGHSHFDQLMKREITALLDDLLGSNND